MNRLQESRVSITSIFNKVIYALNNLLKYNLINENEL